jgi:hypothetical protein
LHALRPHFAATVVYRNARGFTRPKWGRKFFPVNIMIPLPFERKLMLA